MFCGVSILEESPGYGRFFMSSWTKGQPAGGAVSATAWSVHVPARAEH